MRFINKPLALAAAFSLALFAEEDSLKKDKALQEPPVLKAKQSLDNIRFITQDGKYTYYQRRSGDLQVFTNYDNKSVLEGEKLTQYAVHGTKSRKKLAISKDESFHQRLSHLKTNKIHTVDFGGGSPVLQGEGLAPRLHLEDRYLSFYSPQEKKIVFKRLGDGKETKIPILAAASEFFIPQRVLPTPTETVYTDLNEKGIQAALLRSFVDNKVLTVFKGSAPGNKLEICLRENSLIVGEFARAGGKSGSRIIQIPLYNNEGFSKTKTLYQSQNADIGNMICSGNEVYFIKTVAYEKDLNLKETEVASLNLETMEARTLTSLKKVTQLVNMDGTILAPLRGKYFIVKGSQDLANDEIKKEKSI